jgi:hypothetical protein
MLDYIGTLPMWVQLIIVFGGMSIGLVVIGSVLYRLVKFGLKVKVGPVEIDATEENKDVK